MVALTTLLVACHTVPITGRKQFNLLSESTLMSMSITQYDEVLASSTVLPATDTRTKQVKRVGKKIIAACEKYLNSAGQIDRVENFEWEFNVIEESTINAWCMPGGKIAFYTGILPVCEDDAGIAVVMGHEIAHAVARHGNERMSQQLAIQAGGIGIAIALNEKPALTRDLFLLSYGVGSQLGSLAFSRSHESEADKMGLVFMTIAGYDPNEAVAFWERMSAQGSSGTPELLSTHPSDEKRVQELREYIPVAQSYANDL